MYLQCCCQVMNNSISQRFPSNITVNKGKTQASTWFYNILQIHNSVKFYHRYFWEAYLDEEYVSISFSTSLDFFFLFPSGWTLNVWISLKDIMSESSVITDVG